MPANFQHESHYSDDKGLGKKIYHKNQPTSFNPANTQHKKADIKNYTRIKHLVDDVTILDFETTGGSHLYHEVIQIGAIKYRNGKEIQRFNEFVRPKTSIPTKITRLTGITNQMVQSAKPTIHLFNQLCDFLQGEVLVAHNASFDMKFLLSYLYRFQISHEKFNVIDSVPLARTYLTQLPNHKLETIKHFLKIKVSSHQAINDCLVTGELYYLCKMLATDQINMVLL